MRAPILHMDQMKQSLSGNFSQNLPSGISPHASNGNLSSTPTCQVSQTSQASRKVTRANKSMGGHGNDMFQISLVNILQLGDCRTTIMIKNIPNKYTQQMLLETIDYSSAGKYDFFYLPIDIKNQCNVGYAFINFIHPVFVVDFYNHMNGKSW